MIDNSTYKKLCDKYSSQILQRVICPYCGFVYSSDDSIDLGMGSDCEDEVITVCMNCNNKIIIHSAVVEPRFWTTKYEEK